MTKFRNPIDGFVGEVIGLYTTLEGERGMVLQQIGTRVVHAYQINRLTPEDKWQTPEDRGETEHARQSAR